MQETRNPRVIPTLIGLLDLNDSRRIGFNPFENVLRQITRVGWNGTDTERTHDSVWWRLWWHDNKKQYPAEVQKLPIPNFHKVKTDSLESAHPVASRRRLERVLVSEDPKRAYWLLAPGWVPSLPMTDAEKSAVANSGLKRLAAVKEDRPGLIVVLQDGDADEPSLLDPWLDVADALDRRYYVAVAIRPRWNEKAAGQWLTQKDRAAFPMAQFSTEAFAEQIVQQLKLNVSLNPDHIFLVAEGKAGTAGYACALQKSTAFQGFCLLSAPLRTTLLPPLPAAKNRRFFLALGIEGMGGTDSLAAAAEPLLKQQGAQIQAERVKSGSIADGVQHAVRWLETK